ncbi:hypothetical protein [uncultured Megasphaera sp.]|uniref:hypothetical protein n=1 Tax=uncultured Megasphaera sp. TaxID=165188 RepID=UPI00265A3867|nr:hypothetical protein [uncultured Megasphaera sp.]
MKKNKFKSLREEYCWFQLHDIYFGGLTMIVRMPFRSQLTICFDELESDGIPGMIQLYNALQNRQPYDFYVINNTDKISFEIRDFTDAFQQEFVHFSVRVGDDGEGLRYKSEIQQDVPVPYLLNEFETFFASLLHHPDFPFQYPCFVYLPPSVDKIYDALEQDTGHIPLTDARYRKLEKKYLRERVTGFEEPGNELARQFKEMLTTYRVPDGWAVQRKTGQEVHHHIF